MRSQRACWPGVADEWAALVLRLFLLLYELFFAHVVNVFFVFFGKKKSYIHIYLAHLSNTIINSIDWGS